MVRAKIDNLTKEKRWVDTNVQPPRNLRSVNFFCLCMNKAVIKDNSLYRRSRGLDTHSQLVRNAFGHPFGKVAAGLCWL